MAPHSSTFAWKIPWTEEPRRLQSMGSLRVGHDWATSLSLFTFLHWRRKWQPTPVFLPGESQGRGSLVGCVYGVAQSRTRLKWLSSSRTQSTHSLRGFSILQQLKTHIFRRHACHSRINSTSGVKATWYFSVKVFLTIWRWLSSLGDRNPERLWDVESGICLVWAAIGKSHARFTTFNLQITYSLPCVPPPPKKSTTY